MTRQALLLGLLQAQACLAIFSVSRRLPDCAVPGLQVGAGLGTVAGAVGGVAAAGGAATLATCPTMAITTIAGSSVVRTKPISIV